MGYGVTDWRVMMLETVRVMMLETERVMMLETVRVMMLQTWIHMESSILTARTVVED